MCTWFSASWRRFRYDRKCPFSCIYNPQITVSPTSLFSANFNGSLVKNHPKAWTCPLNLKETTTTATIFAVPQVQRVLRGAWHSGPTSRHGCTVPEVQSQCATQDAVLPHPSLAACAWQRPWQDTLTPSSTLRHHLLLLLQLPELSYGSFSQLVADDNTGKTRCPQPRLVQHLLHL